MSNGTEPTIPSAAAPSEPKIWGYFATFGWALLGYAVAMVVATGVLYLWDPAAFPIDLDHSGSMKDARYVGATTILSNLVIVAVLAWAARRAGWTAKDYLALNWATRPEVVTAIVSMIVLLPAMDTLAYVLGQPIIPDFVSDIYRNAQQTGTLLLLWLAIVIVAPIGEEIIFRGFIYRGWVRPEHRPMVGILAVTILFAIVHIQYNWFGVLQVFLIGLLLTWVRWRSGSTPLAMLLHVIANFYAMMQAVIFLDWLAPATN
jgi:membrane protease YdiL (CAAX protease family)